MECPSDGCTIQFSRRDSVYPHLRKFHHWSPQQTSDLKEQWRIQMRQDRQSTNDYRCPHCEESLSNKKRLLEHIRMKHPDEVRDKVPTVGCPVDGCDDAFHTREELSLHCGYAHAEEEDQFEIEGDEFGDEEEFEHWKREFEHFTGGSFTVESKKKTVTYFWCPRGNRQRREEECQYKPRTRRAQRHCSAFITATYHEDGTVSAKFCRDHVGHPIVVAKNPITEADRQYLNSLIDQRFQLKKLRSVLRELGKQHRLYHISTRMLRSMVYNRELKEWRQHDDAHFSVVARFEKGETEGLRRAEINNDDSDSMRIVIIAPTQLKWLEKYSSRGIVLDDTFKTCKSPVKLLTLIVLDEYDRGLPAAHLLSYHMKEADVKFMFEVSYLSILYLSTRVMVRSSPFYTYTYLKRGLVARLDQLCHTLLTVPEEMEDDREIEDELDHDSGKYRLSESGARHRKAVEDYSNEREKMRVISKMRWEVISSTDNEITYVVRDKGAESCDCEERNLHCWACLACPRRYECTCKDGRKSGIACKHIHAVLTYRIPSDTDPDEPQQFMRRERNLIAAHHDYGAIQEIENDNQEIDLHGGDEEAAEREENNDEDDGADEELRERQHLDEQISFRQRDFHLKMEEMRKRFNHQIRQGKSLDEMDSALEVLSDAIDCLPRADNRGRAPLPKKIRDKELLKIPEIGRVTLQICMKCMMHESPNVDGLRTVVNWIECPKCRIWAHSVCVPEGAICEACQESRME